MHFSISVSLMNPPPVGLSPALLVLAALDSRLMCGRQCLTSGSYRAPPPTTHTHPPSPPIGPTVAIHYHLILSPDSADRLQTTMR